MNAASEKNFDQASLDTGRALWPGKIRIAGTEYDVALVHGETWIEFRDGDQSGTRQVASIHVELPKSVHPAAPKPESIVEDRETHKLYRLKRTGGLGANDTSWLLDCVIDD